MPEVKTPDSPRNQSELPGQSNKPVYKKNSPRPDSQPEPKVKIARTAPVGKTRQTIIQTAMTAVGKPYRWGGLSPKGFDCSGLVVYAYKKIGIHVPRTAKAQFKKSTSITRRNIKPADLVFFSVPRRRGGVHVGIYIGKGLFVHAPGRGRKVKHASLNNIYFKQHFIKAGNFLKKDAG
ncbi:NlpC/P60 family protein [Desulfobacter hydrogenophilus]|uniref:NlpC/P60 family protein n=1 Tax=Desulfobacter hydrogenophilus TaxID=2291 RepID=A0A328FER5_9BACT|nr:C40 family peptidase [Desulfobacter hydrogenophilus]NDY72502.1 C40 family peptidase [Desulfobacter hydrogenophilus]QBH14167.1 NlpC/P60 family protein [Desulfobacter hydrogenophilus]RAM01545.1 NlpC/P60 family protein [Desulfobacter hydrogenophilus]